MARKLCFLVLISLATACSAAIIQPITESHRSAALELFVPADDGSFGSLEETYEALRTFQILGIEHNADTSSVVCPLVVGTFSSLSFEVKELFYALKVNDILRCQISGGLFEDIALNLQAFVKGASTLLDFYYSIGSLVLTKEQSSESIVSLEDADGIFHSIKALSQSDGRWRYGSNSAESSTFAAGLAFEALAGVVVLASPKIDQSMVGIVKNDMLKLFDSLESYDDGALYFDEKLVDASEHHGSLSTTSSVVRGVTAFAAVITGTLNLPGDKILGLANFFLGIGIPGTSKDLFNQIDSLACLDNNRVSIPLILSLPAAVLSLSSNDQLKVKVNTVLGSGAPPLTVNLVQAISGSKAAPVVENQQLKFDNEGLVHSLDFLSKGIDVGKYTLVFEILLHDPENEKIFATGGPTQALIFVTGFIKIDNSEIAVLDSDTGSAETLRKFDLSSQNAISLSANHLQKLRLSFHLTTPVGNAFNPHQVFLKLRHETKVEHIFVLGNSGKKFEIILDFLGLVEKFYYLSGKYDIELTVGDATMENSFLWALGHVELDLPDPPEKATRPPPQPVNAYSRFGPKPEIAHIFRVPEKRPPGQLSLAFLALTLFPFIGFLVGLLRLGVNMKNFPSAPLRATFAVLFHAGIAGVLLLYVLFWMKLDLFTTLKALGFIGIFLVFVGHRTLAYLASTSAKLKSA